MVNAYLTPPPPPQEFDGQLKRFMDGDVTLVSDLGAMKLALRAAISNGFHTSEVLKSFAAREPLALRARLGRLSEDLKLGRLSGPAFSRSAVEVVFALQRLGEELLSDEKALLNSASAQQKAAFEATSTDGTIGEEALKALAGAGSGVAAGAAKM